MLPQFFHFFWIIKRKFSFIKLFNFYYFGQQRYGIKTNNPFIRNEWGEQSLGEEIIQVQNRLESFMV